MDYQNLPKIINSTWKKIYMLFCNICSVSHFMKRWKQKQIKGGWLLWSSICFLYCTYAELRSKKKSTKDMQQEILQCIIDAKYGLSNENGQQFFFVIYLFIYHVFINRTWKHKTKNLNSHLFLRTLSNVLTQFVWTVNPY